MTWKQNMSVLLLVNVFLIFVSLWPKTFQYIVYVPMFEFGTFCLGLPFQTTSHSFENLPNYESFIRVLESSFLIMIFLCLVFYIFMNTKFTEIITRFGIILIYTKFTEIITRLGNRAATNDWWFWIWFWVIASSISWQCEI